MPTWIDHDLIPLGERIGLTATKMIQSQDNNLLQIRRVLKQGGHILTLRDELERMFSDRGIFLPIIVFETLLAGSNRQQDWISRVASAANDTAIHPEMIFAAIRGGEDSLAGMKETTIVGAAIRSN